MATTSRDRRMSGYAPTDRVWVDPSNTNGATAGQRAAYYDRCFAYYSNEAFGDLAKWAAYKDKNWLYKHHRSIYNPFRRLVEFYVGEIYPGVLPMIDLKLPPGVPSAIPFSEGIDPRLERAIMQFWQWSNWASGKDLVVRFGSMTGCVLVELVDDLARRKVTTEIHWPGKVSDLLLDATGNVKYFALEYQAPEMGPDGKPTGETYVYRKEVDTRQIRYYKDGKPYDYGAGVEGGAGAVVAHPYTFCPAVWYKHFDIGDVFGQPIMWATLGKVDELNSLASMLHDQVAKIVKSPVVVTSEATTAPLTVDAARAKVGGTTTEGGVVTTAGDRERKERQEVKILRLPPGSDVKTVPLSLGEGLSVMERYIGEIEHDHPELAMYQALRSMGNISGIAAARLMGDVANLVYSAEAAYDTPSTSLFRMAVAIAGYRLNNGDWEKGTSRLTAQHEYFRPFDLESYAAGKLNYAIAPRLVVEETELERWQTEKAKADALNAKAASPGLGVPTNKLQLESGYTEEEVEEFAEQKAAAQEEFGAALLGAFNSGAGVTPTGASSGGSQARSNADAGNEEDGSGNSNSANPGRGGS